MFREGGKGSIIFWVFVCVASFIRFFLLVL